MIVERCAFYLLSWLLLTGCDPGPAPAARANGPALRAEGGELLDREGRRVLLRGVNARVAGLFDVTFADGRLPLEPIPPFGEEDCRFLGEDLGHNLLRLPISWSALEPERGKYDQAYLDRVLGLVDTCAAHGVYTLVDLHQDGYSKEIGEDGAPLWAISPPPERLLGGPLDDLTSRRTSRQVLAAFESLYANRDGLADAYAAMAAHVGAQLGEHPGAIGLELQNEPVTLGDAALLDAFHARVAARVRAAAPDLMLIFEPDSLRNLLDAAPVEAPFPFANSAYAPHVYTQVFSDGWRTEDVDSLRLSVRAAVRESQAHGAPLLVGEFGNAPQLSHGLRFIRESLALFDEVGASWAFWAYEEWTQGAWGLYESDGTARGALRAEAADLLARPFPEAVSGRVTRIAWSPEQRTLTVGLAEATGGLHRLTAPRRVWPAGAAATCDGHAVETRAFPGRVELRCAGAELVLRAR
jgi:endoglycosylceramidase